jgi:hypothetical protein
MGVIIQNIKDKGVYTIYTFSPSTLAPVRLAEFEKLQLNEGKRKSDGSACKKIGS